MGAHMARNLLKGGENVTVFDLNAEAVKSLKASGASSAGTTRSKIKNKHNKYVLQTRQRTWPAKPTC